ncbi:uncharacterized protein si:ch211-199g17.2 [Electrophorus electricus]|uniref:uncharacterized protein si:ch211-199g17.2 n=1 Tax=Electrophorus electricus TaxID=8005 RepID=UPI0015D05477|nr:uncharacterized protein si:ch211-199g17.2 [Electrophorus electricus]
MSKMFACQNCDQQYEKIKDFKMHVRSYSHKKVVADCFNTALHCGPVFFPICVVLDYLKNPKERHPLIGLDMVTLFITPQKCGSFYLCHVCEQQLSAVDIVHHLCSEKHYFKYLSYSNPELLCFAWLEDSFSYLEYSVMEENSINGSGTLRIFELPGVMLRRGKRGSYHQVMGMLSETEHLVEQVVVGRPLRKTLQAYIKDPARTNPLLGLNFLLEYSCPEDEQHCGYLCLLCQKKLQATESISHCISFHHVCCYLEAAHPAMMDYIKNSYTSSSFDYHKRIVSLATRAQKDSPPGELQCVHVDLSGFKDIDSSCYETALDKLQLIRKERNRSEMMAAAAAAAAAPGDRILFDPETQKSDLATTDSPAERTTEKAHEVHSVGQDKDDLSSCRILCVECDEALTSIEHYKMHIEGREHNQRLVELFGKGGHPHKRGGGLSDLGVLSVIKLYKYMSCRHGRTSPSPLIGLQLLTVFVDRHSQCFNPPIYLCHACELNIPVSSVCAHLSSLQHYFSVFKYTNPDLVYLVSQNLDHMRELAQEAGMSQGKDKKVLQVCEIPGQLSQEIRNMAYKKILAVIQMHSSKLRQCVEVQRPVTLLVYSKSCDRKSPLLGLQFMVKYSTAQPDPKCGYLCLLCESKFPERDATAHVLTFAHVLAYLNVAHPGSLSKEDIEKRSLITDLAEQAQRVSSGALQEVELNYVKFCEVEISTFKTAMNTLQLIFKEKGLGELKPSVAPGDKLVPSYEKNSQNNSSESVKEEIDPTSYHTDQIKLDAIYTEASKMAKKTDSQSASLVPKHVESPKEKNSANSDCAIEHPVKSSVQAAAQLSLTSASSPLPASHTQKDKYLNQAVHPCPNPTEAEELCPMLKHPQHQDMSFTQKQSQKLAQETGESSQSPAHVKNETQTVSQTSPTCTELWDYLRTTNREPVIGLSSVTECHTEDQPPCYMCMTCTERFPENSIIKHLTSRDHQHMYLKSIDYVSLRGKKKVEAKWLRTQAIMLERSQGYGEAQVLDLEAEDYHQILNAPILTALGKLRDSLCKLISNDDRNILAASSMNDYKCDGSHGSKVLKVIERTEEKDTQDLLRGIVKAEYSKSDTALTKQPLQNLINPLPFSKDPTQSSPHLWSYLTSPTRTEPVIGLSMITEYRTSTHQNSFLCSCCKVILSTTSYMTHLINPRHRFNYIKNKHSKLVASWGDKIKLTCKIADLREKAKFLQDKEGWGCIKVVEKESSKKKEKEERKAKELEPSQITMKSASTKQQDQKRLNLTKHLKKKKKTKPSAMIGLNFVTCVSHGKKKLLFCELCSVRCHLDHLCSVAHRKIYLEHKYPGWTANGENVEKKLHKIALRLAAVERTTGIGMKKLDVSAKVFTDLRTAPLCTALSNLQLLQTNSDTSLMLSASPSSLQTNPDTISDHTNDDVHSYPMCPVDPASVSASSCPSLSSLSISLHNPCDPSSPLTPTADLHVPDRSYSPISPAPPPSYSPTSLPLSSPIPGPPPLSSQPEAPLQYQSAPPVLYAPPIFLPPACACQDSPHVGLPHSTTPPISVNPTASLSTHSAASPLFHVTSDSNCTTPALSVPTASELEPPPAHHASLLAKPQSSGAQWKSGDRSQLECRQSILGEESRPPAITPPHTYSFPNLPTVAGQSIVSAFLSVSNTEPVIGLCNILECRKIPQATFFLCLNCAERINRVDICDHMTSERHQYHSIRIQYPEIFQEWQWKTICNLMIRDLAGRLALLEKHFDAKVIMLNEKQYEHLYSADFDNAIKLLQQMYGREQSLYSLAPCYTVQDQRNMEIYDARVPQNHVEIDREVHGHQPQQSCSLSPSQTKQSSLHTIQVPKRALDRMQCNFRKSKMACIPTMDELQASENPQEADTQAEAPYTLHQFIAQTGLTAKSDGKECGLHPPDSHRERKTSGCANSLQAQYTARELQPAAPEHAFPCITTIKQEKPDQVSHEKCFIGPHSLETLSSHQSTMIVFKHSTDLKEYVNSKRATSDAVVGLSSVIECVSEGQPPLYFCVSCSSKLDHDLIINHLVKCGHRNSYLRARYPWLFEEWFDSDIRTQSRKLMWYAHTVETYYEDEPGQLQEVKMKYADLKVIKDMSFDKAIIQLQKIRKKQKLCALQTCISPKIRIDLVKQEKVETEVTAQHSQELLDFPVSQDRRTASKHKDTKPDLFNWSPPLVKRLKISSDIQSRVTFEQKVVEESAIRLRNKDLFPGYKSTKSNQLTQKSEQTKSLAKTKPVNSILFSSKDNLNLSDPQLTAHISDFHSGKLKQDISSSHSKSTQGLSKITLAEESTGHYTSKKVDEQMHNLMTTTKAPKLKMADIHTSVYKSDTRPIGTLSAAKLQKTTEESKASTINDVTSPKEKQVITKSLINPVTKTDKETLRCYSFTTSHMKPSSSIEISSVPSEFPVKKIRGSDNVTYSLSQVQKEASILRTVNSDQLLPSHCVPLPSKEPSIFLRENSTASPATKNPSSFSRGLDHCSQTSSELLGKTLCKAEDSVVENSQGHGLSSISTPQQKKYPDNTGTISAPSVEVQGLEIARLPDTRPLVKKRSNENAWNYENRQFNSETHATFNTSILANSSGETVAMKGQYRLLSQQNSSNKQNPDFDWKISANGWDSSAYICTENGFNPSATSTMSYPIQKNGANTNFMISECGPAAPGISPAIQEYAMPSEFSQSIPAYASVPVYQTPPVYQSFQNSKIDDAYYRFYAYNQAFHPNQTVPVNENVPPSASAHGYEGVLYPPSGWQQSQSLLNFQKPS